MAVFMYIVQNVLSQAVFIIGFVVIIGMLAQKQTWDKILPSTIKTMIGFTMINIGGQTLGMSLLPLQPMISKIFKVKEVATDIGAAQAESLADIGTEMALIFAFGFFTNLLLARFTRFKYVHLSAHVSFFFSGLIAALLKFGTNEELRKLNERLSLESTYEKLTTKKIEKSESWVNEVLKTIGKNSLITIGTGLLVGSAKILVKNVAPEIAESGFNIKKKSE